jgi:hypothetical protein
MALLVRLLCRNGGRVRLLRLSHSRALKKQVCITSHRITARLLLPLHLEYLSSSLALPSSLVVDSGSGEPPRSQVNKDGTLERWMPSSVRISMKVQVTVDGGGRHRLGLLYAACCMLYGGAATFLQSTSTMGNIFPLCLEGDHREARDRTHQQSAERRLACVSAATEGG